MNVASKALDQRPERITETYEGWFSSSTNVTEKLPSPYTNGILNSINGFIGTQSRNAITES